MKTSLEELNEISAAIALIPRPKPPAPAVTTCTTCGSTRRAIYEYCPTCERRARTLAWWEETTPARYRWCSFDAPELALRVHDPSAIAKARAVGATLDRVVLVGPAGVGKTTLACAVMQAVASRGTAVKFVEARLLGVARAQHGLGEGEPEIVKGAMGRECLVLIDDLGAEANALQSAVADVIHARHADMLPTLITSGFTKKQILDRYGDAIARRVFEGAVVIDVKPRGSR